MTAQRELSPFLGRGPPSRFTFVHDQLDHGELRFARQLAEAVEIYHQPALAEAPTPPLSLNSSSLSNLRSGFASPLSAHPIFPESYCQEPLLPQDIVQLASIAWLPALVPEERIRLTPDQAIHIFKLRTTKTARTAALLSAKYGLTPKAIRDIWTRKSWAQDTRPFWTLLEESSARP